MSDGAAPLTANGLLRWVLSSEATLAKAFRFGLVGVTSGGIFALVTSALTSLAGWDPKLASVGGYLASMPINFVANRSFSFRSKGALSGDLTRYAVVHAINIVFTASAMSFAVDYLELHYIFGVIAAVVLVPVLTFIAMNLWVFARRRG